MNKKFAELLDKSGEVGFVGRIISGLVYAKGLPSVKLDEVVMFEEGQLGQVLGLTDEWVEILMFDQTAIRVGEQVANTGEVLSVGVGRDLLGRRFDGLGRLMGGGQIKVEQVRRVAVPPPGLGVRKVVEEPLETGVSVIDLVVPLGKGQRQLLVGDRKTGKTKMLLQTVLSQARTGTICIYAAIGKRSVEIKKSWEFFEKKGVVGQMVLVSASAAEEPGMVLMAPYTALAMAEYFAEQSLDVLVVMDELTSHAKYYREISLAARRFPGRSAYPGDIFYVHAQLMERAGNFKKGSITLLGVAETVMGDLSGYIQTNLMAMTDGHVFFDRELANLGRRPAVNPFLSVTRVGKQAQTDLVRDIGRELSAFLVRLEELQEYTHFGAELSEKVQQSLKLGERILILFNQASGGRPLNVSVFLLARLWAGAWMEAEEDALRKEIMGVESGYLNNPKFKEEVDKFVGSFKTLTDMVQNLKESGGLVRSEVVFSREAGSHSKGDLGERKKETFKSTGLPMPEPLVKSTQNNGR